MPIYEYRCQECGAEFEKRVPKADDSGGVVCPSCGQRRVDMRLSTFAVASSGSRQTSSAPGCPSAGGCPNRGMCGMG